MGAGVVYALVYDPRPAVAPTLIRKAAVMVPPVSSVTATLMLTLGVVGAEI